MPSNTDEIRGIVDLLHDSKRADALEKIEDILNAKAAEALDVYKKVVADTYFDEPTDEPEEQ